MKKLICMMLLISTLMLSSCSFLDYLSSPIMPTVYIRDTFFENDTWLVVDDQLINKTDGTVCSLEEDPVITNQLAAYAYSACNSYIYDCVFEESSFTLYTFVQPGRQGDDYRKCTLTYGYDGQETERSYADKWSTEAELNKVYEPADAFTFEVKKDGWGRSDESPEGQAILDFVKERYDVPNQAETSSIVGLAKRVGEELWFYAVVSNRHSLGEYPEMGGIHRSEVMSYHPETNEFKTVYEYNKKGKQIIDFDEEGIYVLDTKGNFSYVNFQSGKSTLLYRYEFSDSRYSVEYFAITDGYIGASYTRKSMGRTYFAYQKGGSVITNHS